jgi:hypothetical protein
LAQEEAENLENQLVESENKAKEAENKGIYWCTYMYMY